MSPNATVLYLLDYAGLGGGETSFLYFLAALRRLAPGIRPLAVVAQRGPLMDALQGQGIETVHVDYPRCFRRGPWPWVSLRSVRRLTALARGNGAALVHANNLFGMFYGGLAARRAGLPLLWTCHGWYEAQGFVKGRLARHLPAHIACVSGAVRQAVEAALGAEAAGRRVSVDYLGIPPFEGGDDSTRQAVRAELGLGPEPVAGVAARFQPVKGHQYLIEALPSVLKRAPGLKLLLIGDAMHGEAEERAHKASIERRVAELGLGERVIFLGHRPDARRLLRGLDLLVIPSERETFSMAAVEGLEAGIPVLGPDGDGPREIIDAPACGLRFAPRNVDDLAEKMIRLLIDAPGAGFDPAAGPRRCRELFTAEAHARRSLALYARLAPRLAGAVPGNW